MALAILLGGAACGGDDVADKIEEKAGVSTDDQGNVAVTDKEGNEVEFNAEGEGSLPDDWPENLPLPEGAKIISSSSSKGPPASMHVIAGVDGKVSEVADELESTFEKADFTIDNSSDGSAGGFDTSSFVASGPDYSATVTVSDTPSGQDEGDVTVGVTLSATQG